MATPIYTTSSFTGFAVTPVKQGSGPVVNSPAGDSPTPTRVALALSDGTTSIVFDRVTTGLRCMTFMSARQQWLLSPNDDIGIALIPDKGLLLYEQTLLNQRLFTSFFPTYQSGRVLFAHRTLSQMLPLEKALEACGYANQATEAWDGNEDMVDARIVLVDINYPLSKLVDESAIVYNP